MKTLINIIAAVMVTTVSFAQQNSLLNHYIFNHMTLNPAYVGTKQFANINFTSASQWTGLDGAPCTQVLSVEGPISKSNGLGLQLINDKIGAQRQQSIYGSFSHIVRLNEKWRLSMGLSVGASYFTLDGTMLQSDQEYDPSVPKEKVTTFRFDPKTGVFLYSNRFYAGFSISDLLDDILQSNDKLITAQKRHYYLTSGYVFDIGPMIKVKPSFLLREDLKSQSTFDLNTFVLFKEIFWVGCTYRFGAKSLFNEKLDNTLSGKNAVVFLTEWNINKRFIIGYSYTQSLTALSGFSGHEIELAYMFGKKAETRMRTPRFF
jgi:type IX secretion system PorP/SprF family membrane protein